MQFVQVELQKGLPEGWVLHDLINKLCRKTLYQHTPGRGLRDGLMCSGCEADGSCITLSRGICRFTDFACSLPRVLIVLLSSGSLSMLLWSTGNTSNTTICYGVEAELGQHSPMKGKCSRRKFVKEELQIEGDKGVVQNFKNYIEDKL